MSVIRFDPWRDLDSLFRPLAARRPAAWVPAASVSQSAAAYRIDMDLPAVAAADVEVSVKERRLTISGRRGGEAPEGFEAVRAERPSGEFSRTFLLPKDASEDDIEASSRDGVLTVIIPKMQEAGPRRIEIVAA